MLYGKLNRDILSNTFLSENHAIYNKKYGTTRQDGM